MFFVFFTCFMVLALFLSLFLFLYAFSECASSEPSYCASADHIYYNDIQRRKGNVCSLHDPRDCFLEASSSHRAGIYGVRLILSDHCNKLQCVEPMHFCQSLKHKKNIYIYTYYKKGRYDIYLLMDLRQSCSASKQFLMSCE